MSCQCPTKIQIAGNATVGNTITNPFGAEWIYAMNKYYDWKCIETEDGVNFTIHTTIEVGNGVDITYFKDYGHNFTFDPGHNFVLNPPAYLEVGGNTDWTIQERGQIRDALGITGDKITALAGQLQNKAEIGEYDTTLSGIQAEVAGLDGESMRGTDGAYTGIPPTVSGINAELTAFHGVGDWTTGSGLSEQNLHDGLDSYSNKDTYKASLSNIETYMLRALGLMQENQYLDQTVYTDYQGTKLLTSARIRTYSNAAAVGSSSDVLAIYQITTTWSNSEMISYKVVKT